MDKDYSLQYQSILSAIYLESLKQLLIEKKVITQEEWAQKVNYILSDPLLKEKYDEIEFYMNMQNICSKKDPLNEEDEKYLLSKGVKYYTEDEIKSLIDLMKNKVDFDDALEDV